MREVGTVYLVGAGPGDPGLITRRGEDLLRRADVVLHDALVHPELLRLCRAEAEIINAGKRPNFHVISQDEANEIVVVKAREGKCVVRLKGGDPCIFGRGGEEAENLAKSGIPFEVVPGVSSISAVPIAEGIPLTHRDHCSSFMVVSGHHDPEGVSGVDWPHVAQCRGTVCVLMGVRWLRSVVSQLQEHGMDPDRPAALIQAGTTDRQTSLFGTLATIADQAEANAFSPPAVLVLGGVVEVRKRLAKSAAHPLAGQRIVVTRASEQAGKWVENLRALGGRVLQVPVIQTTQTTRKTELKDALLGLNAYQWVVFTSTNGVRWFFHYFFRAFKDLRDLGGVRIAAVGEATAAKLRDLHLQVDLVPEEAAGIHVARAMQQEQSIENIMILLVRAEEANPELPAELERAGAIVDDVAVYRTVADHSDPFGDAQRMLAEGADWITFTSGSTVRNFHDRFDLPGLLQKFPGAKIVSIGPETTKALRSIDLVPNLEAKSHSTQGMLAAMVDSLNRQSRRI